MPLRCLAVAVLLALTGAAAPAAAQTLMLGPDNVGAPSSGAAAELSLPPGRGGPVPAVVMLHGCDGIRPHYRVWARLLSQWGYAALLVDSFRPRGFTDVCNRGGLVPPALQGADAFAGAQYLRTLPFIRADRIGVIGFSHGGSAVLQAVLGGSPRPPGASPFAAAVAFYPGCNPPTAPLETDTLILIGSADDWSPPERCRRWRATAQANGHVLQFKEYPGALHGFDSPRPPHQFAGHRVGRDPAATEDSLAETRGFFAARLMAP